METEQIWLDYPEKSSKFSQLEPKLFKPNHSVSMFQSLYVAVFLKIDFVSFQPGKSVFQSTDTYKDRNIETERVWLD